MVVLVLLIALILVAPYVFQLVHKDSIIDAKEFDKALAVLQKAKSSQNGNKFLTKPGNENFLLRQHHRE